MPSLESSRNLFVIFVAALFLIGLTACGGTATGERQGAASEEETATQEPARSTATPTPRPAPQVTVTLPAGTEIYVALSSAIGSATSQVGDQLTATATQPVVAGDRVAIPSGSTIHGEVVDVVPAKKGLKVSEKGGSIQLAFNHVMTPGGTSAGFAGSLASMAKSGKKTGSIIGGSAAGGAVLGKILGGDNKDAVVGAVLGTGIGTAIAAGTKGKEVEIPVGTEMVITLDEPLTIAVK